MQNSLERLRQRREESESGFTLIELLIVIVILGILAAIVVFAVQNLTGQAAGSSCQTDVKTVESAAEVYKAQEGAYPGALADLTTAVGNDGPWLKEVPSTAHYTIALGTGTGGNPGTLGSFPLGTVVVSPSPVANPAVYSAQGQATFCANLS